jgi:hypothetical protein
MKRRIFSLAAIGAVAVLGTALFLFSPTVGFTQVKTATQPAAPAQLAALNSTLEPLQEAFRAVTQKVLPSVVEIDVTQTITQDRKSVV